MKTSSPQLDTITSIKREKKLLKKVLIQLETITDEVAGVIAELSLYLEKRPGVPQEKED